MCATGRGADSRGESNTGSGSITDCVSEKKIAAVCFLLPTCLPVERAKARASSTENRKIHLVSSVAEVIVSEDSVLNDSPKDVAKEEKRISYVVLGSSLEF